MSGGESRVREWRSAYFRRPFKTFMSRLTLLASLLVPLTSLEADNEFYRGFEALVRTATWQEMWPNEAGESMPRSVTAEIWTEAMQAVLNAQNTLHIPVRDLPYYLDGPLVLKSGQTLTADPGAEIRLKPGTNTCMVRNENLVGFADQPVPSETVPDTDITIEGGIWTTLSTARNESNGNRRGASARTNAVPGTHGVILLQNVRGVTVRNVTVRQSRAFGIHIANAQDFTIDGVTLEGHYRDGVHVNGPSSRGLIRRVGGDSHDDTVALNAWEWENYAPSFGPIHHIVVEEISGAPEEVPSANSIRLLPGRKKFRDGTTLDCPIHDVTVRQTSGITEFKLYDQPNLELGRDKDFSDGIGTLKSLRFEDLTFHRPGRIEIHAHLDGLTLQNATTVSDAPLIAIGPKSQTYQFGADSDQWVEIFSPDLDCTARNISVSGVRVRGGSAEVPLDQVIELIAQKPNLDYPNTTPRGGSGKGIWIR